MQRIYDVFHDWGFLQSVGPGIVLAVLLIMAYLARYIRNMPTRVAAATMLMVAGAVPVVVGVSVLTIGFGQPGPRSTRMWVGAVIWGGAVVAFGCRAIGGSKRDAREANCRERQ